MSTMEDLGGSGGTGRRSFMQSRWLLVAVAAASALSLAALVHQVDRGGALSGHHHAVHAAMAGHAEMAAAGPGAEAQRPATIVKPVSCEKLPNVPGKSITTVVVLFPPGAYSPRHRHPGSVSAFVLKGTLRSQLAGGPVGTYTVGQTWFEPPGTIHLFAENASATEPAELLATFIAEDDCGPLVIRD